MFKSIKFKLMAYFTIIIIVVSGGVGIMACMSSINALHKTVDNELIELAKGYSSYIESEISIAKATMNGVANRNVIKSWDWNEQKKAIFAEVDKNKMFAGMFIVDKNGMAHFTNGKTTNVSERTYFKEAMRGNTYFSDLIFSDIMGGIEFFVASPIKNNGIEGVVVGYVKPQYLSNSIKDIIVSTSGGAFIVDEKGNTIADNNMDIVLKQDNVLNNQEDGTEQLAKVVETMIKGEAGTDEYVYEGNTYYCGYHPIGNSGWSIAVKALKSDLFADVIKLRKNLICITSISLIIAIALVYFIGKLFTKPIILATKHAVTMSKLDLTEEVPEKFLKKTDEIGDLARAIHVIAENVKDVMKDIQEHAFNLKDSSIKLSDAINENTATSEEISKAVEVIADGATTQARQSDSVVRELSQLGALITESQELAQEVNTGTIKVKDVNLKGREIIDKLKKEFQLNIDVAKKINSNTHELADQSKLIENILVTISSIANQTNLLALNATIEAARAGEAGKGFGVVAEEISKLADDTKQATEEISDILNKMTNEIEITNKNMNEAGEIVGNVDRYLDKTVSTYDIIENSTGDVIELFKQLNEALIQISENKDKTFSFVEKISGVTQESAASTEEVNASVEEQTASMEEITKSSEKLADIAITMEKLSEKFTI
ncbi:methyl-accepting chemotaxis protein [Vallitalea maricola]|uniref:Methyl-accepting chemotaxis protein n=1 Tax=Vallitalea maricola TaxID=3074433 RepID=A0ACB5UGD2_9FIRM|nr:methyl-accepting chemotaxis protein [Vallitalea sp. AN17-2]